MKILSIILLFITINTYAQEQKYVDMSNMRQFSFGKCNGIDGNNIPNLSRSFYTAETCQNAYLQDDICNIEASTFKKAFEAGVSIEDGKIVKKDIFLKEYKGQCDSWLKVRTRGCKNFIKREATKCGGRGKYSKNNFLNSSAKTHTGLLKTKNTANIQTKTILQKNSKILLDSVWINTKGRVRDISDQERSEFFSAVGSIKCLQPSGKSFTAAATIVDTNKGTPIIIFSGHSTCDENNQRLQPKDCSFYYEQNTGEIRAYQFTQIATNFDCNSSEDSLDMAVAKLEDFEATISSAVILTDSINQERKVDDDGEITYPSKKPNVYEDSTMLLVGYDARYNKIKISKNCGLISNRTGLDPNLKAHDCITTSGYSGGPVLQKKLNKESNKHEYSLVCVHKSAKTFEKNDARYRLFTKETFGQCVPITRELVIPLFKEVGAW